ncbi:MULTISPECIES: VanZ family protein [Vagococcus]|uniref:Teicoplanin resistance protein vanZ n=1 Tax=Vagococcus fluvialis bH819 TaxID=1255619 RepID=A0A1X6WNF7_9ENTE|nr:MULTISPECIES: VanZ family protein [Vagococcus]SLM85810.1 Teicoplanin resistance protein vanZ [Vagococcus fluvialis bH819]HCM90232.1 VanZ family protein [Vagococcus sp.]
MLSFVLAFVILTIYNYKHQKRLFKIMHYREINHYILGYGVMLYLLIMLKEIIGFPSLSNWQRVLNVQGNIFDPNISFIPFGTGILHSDYLNILMFVPLGFLLPLMWSKYHSFKETLKYAFFLSLFIELSQLFTRFRATDINDLITNTFGAVIGWLFYLAVSKWLLEKVKPIPLFQASHFFSFEPKMYVLIAAICSFMS